jgi:hypothetical protein
MFENLAANLNALATLVRRSRVSSELIFTFLCAGGRNQNASDELVS